MEAPRLFPVTSDTITAPWMGIGAVVAGPGTPAIKAMSNLVARVPRVVSLARQCIMPVAVALHRATARAGHGSQSGRGRYRAGEYFCPSRVFWSCQYGRRVAAAAGAPAVARAAPASSSWPTVPRPRPRAPVITGVTAGNGTLTVAFTAPASDGGAAISNYKYSTNNGSTFTAVSPATTTSPIVISGLTDGTAYTVKILAVNSAGDGAASSGVSGTPVGNYASWAAAHGLSGGPTAVGNTGIPNLLLYALNLNPNGSNGSPGTLTGSVLSFSKRAEAVANGDVHYAIEKSDDLGLTNPWTEVTA